VFGEDSDSEEYDDSEESSNEEDGEEEEEEESEAAEKELFGDENLADGIERDLMNRSSESQRVRARIFSSEMQEIPEEEDNNNGKSPQVSTTNAKAKSGRRSR